MREKDDDWFERALTDDEEEHEDRVADDESRTGDGTSDGVTGHRRSDEVDADVSERTDDDNPFEDDFAAAFEDADVVGQEEGRVEETASGESDSVEDEGPFSGGGGGPFDESDDSGGPIDRSGGSGPFDGSGGSGPFDESDDGGTDAFASGTFEGDGGSAFGMGSFDAGGSGGSDFEDEAVDSDIERIDLGIDGLDDMIRGGVPEHSLMATIGSAGTGKTTFGMQFLEEGLANDEKAIYVTLEESRERLIRSAEEKGWPFEAYVADDRLAVVDMDPVEMANSLSSIRSELPQLIDRYEATRLVLDSVSLLEMMYDGRATRRDEVYTFARSLKESGVTTLLTSEADENNPYASRHGIVEYLTDAVYVLQYVRPTDFQETRLAVEIQKIRDAHHSREMKPYEITDEGLSVYRQANIF